MSVIEDKKKKKLEQLKKNRFHQDIFQFVRMRRLDEERVKDLETAKKPKPAEKNEPALGDKVSEIRNRLTGKKRASRERWNRFAATGDSGGRGL